MNQERPAEALALHREALAIFERLDDHQGIAQTCDLLGIASYNACDLIGGRAHYERAIAIWRALDNRRGLLLSIGGLSLAIDYRLEVGHADVAQSLVWANDCVQVSRPPGWRAGEALALIFRGLVHVQGGAYGPALVDLRAALAIAEEIEHREWTADSLHGLAKLSLDLLALDEAHACLTRSLELARELGSMIWERHSVALLAMVLIARGELGRADALLVTVPDDAQQPPTLASRLLLAARAERALAGGVPDEALRLLDELVAETINGGTDGRTAVPYLGHLRGRALASAGQLSAAAADLERSHDAARAQGRPDLLWRIHADLARVYGALGRSADAGREAAAAQEAVAGIVQALATTEGRPEAVPLAEQFAQRALASLPAPARTVSTLTPREHEVAALVAEGKSNREIAQALVLSERTAERHVANIMAKLGMSSRTQIAVWVTQTR
jgi:DNA-binding CsgD family transcriptional regulator